MLIGWMFAVRKGSVIVWTSRCLYFMSNKRCRLIASAPFLVSNVHVEE